MWFSLLVGIILCVGLIAILCVCYTVWLVMYINAVNKGIYKEKKNFIVPLAIVVTIIGVISACICIIARVAEQPHHVWYPFMMVGFFGCTWAGLIQLIQKLMKKHIAKLELKKMNIDDL